MLSSASIATASGAGSYFAVAGLAAAFTAADELPALALLAALGLLLLLRAPRETLLAFAPAALVVVVAFFFTNYLAHDSLRPPYMHRSATDADDNWYSYSYNVNGVERDSYWLDRQGIDRGEPTRLVYAVHVLVGHHGIFSLTPVWLLSAWGLLLWLGSADTSRRDLAAMIGALTLVCLVFYIGLRPQEDRNYGGMTSGFRWMFWFTPLWLVVMLPAADRLARSTAGIALASILLSLSALSVSYPTWNPWTHPWIYNGSSGAAGKDSRSREVRTEEIMRCPICKKEFDADTVDCQAVLQRSLPLDRPRAAGSTNHTACR